MTTDTRTFGRVLGETARAAQQVHHQILTREGTDFPSWVVFTLLAEQPPAVAKDALIADHARRLAIDPATSREVVARMMAAGHVRSRVDGDTEWIELTPAGATYLRDVRGKVGEATTRLIGHLPAADVATTLNVLRAVGETATGMLQESRASERDRAMP